MRVIQERLRIFNVNYEQIGAAYRDEVHLRGYWHEVFHCWVVEKIEQQWYIYLQLRSYSKKDYPGQYDITAAGHLMEDETVEDGVREEVAGELVLECNVLAFLDPVVNDESGDEDGGEDGCDDTDDEGGGEALDRT